MMVSIHQPHYFPWLGYLDKLFHSDVFVILDTCDFRKNYYQNRAKIKTNNGAEWLTVPVGTHHKKIYDVAIDESKNWMKKQQKTIYYAYKDCPFFDDYWEMINDEVFRNRWDSLRSLNYTTLTLADSILNIDKSIILASEMRAGGERDDLLVNICLELGADVYFSGRSGRDYLDLKKFKKNKIRVEFQDFRHPVYRQRFMEHGFIKGLSYLDGLFNIGADTLGQLLCN